MLESEPEKLDGECEEKSRERNDSTASCKVEVDVDEFCESTDLEMVMI